jgi:hypothetical protein
MSAYGTGGYQPQSYQDDLNTDDDVADPFMTEEGDDPTETFGVPPSELAAELDKEEDDDPEADELGDDQDIRDDQSAFIEDLDDEDDDNHLSY